MIYDTISHAGQYAKLSENFARAFAFLQSQDLAALENGRYEIDGKQVYATVTDAAHKPWAEGRWEAHRKYADIQVVIRGREIMGFRPIDGMETEVPYNEEKDCLLLRDTPGEKVCVKEGEMAVFFPQDAHRPGISPEDGRETIRKIIVKVRV